MAIANFFAPGFDDQSEQLALDRRRKMAEMLRQQSAQPDQGRMVGQYYVPQSWTQSLAKALGGYVADKEDAAADQQQRALAEAVRGRNAQEMTDFMTAAKGTPEVKTTPEGVDDGGNAFPQEYRKAVPPDMAKALQIGMGSHVPGLQQAAVTLFNQQFVPKTPKWEKYEMPDGQGGVTSGFVDINSANPIGTFQRGGAQPAKVEYVDGVPVNPYAPNQPVNAPIIPKRPDAPNPRAELLVDDGTGKLVPNQPLINAKTAIAKAGATNLNNTVSVAAPENEYNKTVGKGIGDADLAALEAAKVAPDTVRNAQMVRNALKTAITGTGADARYSIQKALETAGIVGEGKAASTEAVMSGMAKMTQAAVKASGLGGGSGFSNADRDFLEKAAGGQISSTRENLLRAADLSERVARAAHAKGSVFLKNAQSNPALANVVKSTVLDDLPNAAPTPKAANGGFEIINQR